jgi:hypothetical protein
MVSIVRGNLAPTFTLRSSSSFMRRCIFFWVLCKTFECTTLDISFALVEYKLSESSIRAFMEICTLFRACLGSFQLIGNLKPFQGLMNSVAELQDVVDRDLFLPVVNVVVVSFHGFKPHCTQPLNNFRRSCPFTAKPYSQVCLHVQITLAWLPSSQLYVDLWINLFEPCHSYDKGQTIYFATLISLRTIVFSQSSITSSMKT